MENHRWNIKKEVRIDMDLKDIVTEEFQQEIQDSFAYATGFGVVFIDKEGNHIGEGSNFTDFCKQINCTEEGAKCCARSNCQAVNIALKTQKPSIYICHAGLVNIEIPLICEGCYAGAVTAGQVFCSEEGYYPQDFHSNVSEWLSDEKLSEYYKKIKTLTPQQIEAVATALANISNYILQNFAYRQAQEKFLLYEKKQAELEKQLKNAQLNMLQKQVTPHFIFNVINSASRMVALEQYDKAEKMLNSFAGMMRYSLQNLKAYVTIEQELDYIEKYLFIQKIRFGSRIQYQIFCDEELKEFSIPFFSLQPLVENSIEHGILQKIDGGIISVTCQKKDNGVIIKVQDNGIGIEEETLTNIRKDLEEKKREIVVDHIGIYNCYNRLKISFERKMKFHIYSKKDQGTSVEIEIQ